MEVLNIEWNQCRLMLKALNKAETIKMSCKLLGISERTIYRLMAKYSISYNCDKDMYETSNMPKYKVISVK